MSRRTYLFISLAFFVLSIFLLKISLVLSLIVAYFGGMFLAEYVRRSS